MPAAGTAVSLQDFSGRPAVDVVINGRGPFPFVIATGTAATAICQDLVNDLGLDATTDPATGQLVVDEMRVGDAILRNVPVGRAASVSSDDESLPRGVLSTSLFANQLLTLDYPNGRMRVLPGELPPADGRRVFESSADDPLPSVPITVGDRAFMVRVDTLAAGALTLPSRNANDVPLADAPLEIGRIPTAAGEHPVSVATVNGFISIGDHLLDIHAITFSDVRAGVPSSIGSIGARILESFTVTIDGRNHRVRLERMGN